MKNETNMQNETNKKILKSFDLVDGHLGHLCLLRDDLFERGLFDEANEVHERIGKLRATIVEAQLMLSRLLHSLK